MLRGWFTAPEPGFLVRQLPRLRRLSVNAFTFGDPAVLQQLRQARPKVEVDDA